MINKYPAWKHAIILIVLVFGVLYSLPNFYGELPAILITNEQAQEIESEKRKAFLEKLEGDLKPVGTEVTTDFKKYILRYQSGDKRDQALALLKKHFYADYNINRASVPDIPDWLKTINAGPLVKGLDLQGGVQAVLDVDMVAAFRNEINRIREDYRAEFAERKRNIRARGFEDIWSVTNPADTKGKPKRELIGLHIEFRKAGDRDRAQKYIEKKLSKLEVSEPPYDVKVNNKEGKPGLDITYTQKQKERIGTDAIKSNIKTLRKRVDALGVSEPVIVQQGKTRIVVQLPGVKDAQEIWNILGKQASVRAFGVHPDDPAERGTFVHDSDQRAPADAKVFIERDTKRKILLKKQEIWRGDMVVKAKAGYSSGKNAGPAVIITLNSEGGDRNYKYSRDHLKRLIAIVYYDEVKTGKFVKKVIDGKEVLKPEKKPRAEVINVATIQSELGKTFEITGLKARESKHLALFLTTGSLKAPMIEVESRTISASLGADNVERGINSIIWGFALVLVFMIVWYRVFGLIANVALIANVFLLVAWLSFWGATLTLPGIAGIVLTLGMAVDANVLIFERIREELRLGNSPQASIYSGYEKAFATIADANITTFIAAVVLLGLGSGPIKGFGVTLASGIVTSMFTAIMVSRALVNAIYGGKTVKTLSIK